MPHRDGPAPPRSPRGRSDASCTAIGTPVTPVQRSIARLLVDGHVDDAVAVARKLGVSVRTCRSRIAELMQALNASSRTRPGALIIQSGIVEPDGAATGTADAEGPPPVSG